MRYALIFMTAAIALAAPLAGQEGGLSVGEMAICTGVEGRMPVGESTQFLDPIDRLYCFTRIVGATDTITVRHVWYFGEEEKARVDLPVRSASWRTWSSKMMLPAWSGTWRVDVLGPGGEVLQSREFLYKPSAK
jgi:hypothetical protein